MRCWLRQLYTMGGWDQRRSANSVSRDAERSVRCTLRSASRLTNRATFSRLPLIPRRLPYILFDFSTQHLRRELVLTLQRLEQALADKLREQFRRRVFDRQEHAVFCAGRPIRDHHR